MALQKKEPDARKRGCLVEEKEGAKFRSYSNLSDKGNFFKFGLHLHKTTFFL